MFVCDFFCISFFIEGCPKYKGDRIMENDFSYADFPEATMADLKQVLGSDKNHWEATYCSESYEWLTSGDILNISNFRDDQAVFFVQGRNFHRLNSKEGLVYINFTLNDLEFTYKDFSDSFKTNSLIAYIINLYAKRRGWFFTDLKFLDETHIVDCWLMGKAEKLNEFYQLAKIMLDVEKDGQWRIEFNTFNVGGSVDSWDIKGFLDYGKSIVQIKDKEVHEIRKPNSFNYCIDD